MFGSDHEGWNAYFFQAVFDVPGFQSAADTKLARALHEGVNRIVAMLEGARARLRPWLQAADVMVVIMLLQQLHEAGIGKVLACFDVAYFSEYCRIHLLGQYLVGILTVLGRTSYHVGDNHSLQVLLIFQRVFHGEYASPRIAQHKEVAAIGTDGLSHLLYLFDKTLSGPQAAISRLVAVIRTELIVFVELKTFAQEEGFKTLHVLVCHGRSAVQKQHLNAWIASKTLSPNIERANPRLDWNHAHTAGFDGVSISEIVRKS